MIRVLCFALALALASTGALAKEQRHLSKGEAQLKVVIETIDHSQQRYPTVGDWQIDKAGNLHITVSKMSDQRYEFLIGMHEAIEAYLAVHAGISPAAVDKFDEAQQRGNWRSTTLISSRLGNTRTLTVLSLVRPSR